MFHKLSAPRFSVYAKTAKEVFLFALRVLVALRIWITCYHYCFFWGGGGIRHWEWNRMECLFGQPLWQQMYTFPRVKSISTGKEQFQTIQNWRAELTTFNMFCIYVFNTTPVIGWVITRIRILSLVMLEMIRSQCFVWFPTGQHFRKNVLRRFLNMTLFVSRVSYAPNLVNHIQMSELILEWRQNHYLMKRDREKKSVATGRMIIFMNEKGVENQWLHFHVQMSLQLRGAVSVSI